PVACAAGAGADAIASLDRESTREGLRRLALAVAIFMGLAAAAIAIGTFDGGNMPKPWGKLAAALPGALPPAVAYHLVVVAPVAVAAARARFAGGRAAGLLLLVTVDLVFLMHPHVGDRPAAAIRRPLSPEVQRLSAAAASAHGRMTAPDRRIA